MKINNFQQKTINNRGISKKKTADKPLMEEPKDFITLEEYKKERGLDKIDAKITRYNKISNTAKGAALISAGVMAGALITGAVTGGAHGLPFMLGGMGAFIGSSVVSLVATNASMNACMEGMSKTIF